LTAALTGGTDWVKFSRATDGILAALHADTTIASVSPPDTVIPKQKEPLA
jgi:hypothetical protein